MAKLNYTCPTCKHLHDGNKNKLFIRMAKVQFFTNTKCEGCKTPLVVYVMSNGGYRAELKNPTKSINL